MPAQNIRFAKAIGRRTPNIRFQLAHKSATINPGDPLVFTTAAAETSSATPVLRKLLAADKTAVYKEGTPVAGIYGFAAVFHYSNSSGNASTQPVPSGISAAGQPIYSIPNYGAGFDPDPNIGFSRIKVHVASDSMVFRGKLDSGTASAVLLNTLAGLIITSTAAAAVYTIDTAPGAGAGCLSIVGWDELDTSYVYFKVLPSFQQEMTGVNYSSQ